MPDKPTILTRRRTADSRLFHVERVELRFSNGVEREYEYLLSGEMAAVIIVAMLDDHRVLMVQEYGIGVEDYQWSLPKGKVDPGESYEEAANRELKEEAGYGARKLQLLKPMTQSPNYMQHKTQIVLAQDLYEERLEGDEPEELGIQTISLNNIYEVASRPDITEARTIAALYLVRDYLLSQ